MIVSALEEVTNEMLDVTEVHFHPIFWRVSTKNPSVDVLPGFAVASTCI